MMTIRQATRADIKPMADLLGLLFTLEADFSIDPDKQQRGLAQLLSCTTAVIWVAESTSDPEIIGLCTLQTVISTAEGGAAGLLEDLIVAPTYRRQGVGSALLSQAVAWAKQHGISRLQLLADKLNTPSLAFYAAQGWHTTQLIALRLTPN